MPRGDGTGPFGQGAFTGRGAGYCAGYVAPGFASRPAFGRGGPGPGAGGWSEGGGAGRGHRNRFYATGVPFRAYGSGPEPALDPHQQVSLLKSEAGRLRSVLEGIERRLEQLQST